MTEHKGMIPEEEDKAEVEGTAETPNLGGLSAETADIAEAETIAKTVESNPTISLDELIALLKGNPTLIAKTTKSVKADIEAQAEAKAEAERIEAIRMDIQGILLGAGLKLGGIAWKLSPIEGISSGIRVEPLMAMKAVNAGTHGGGGGVRGDILGTGFTEKGFVERYADEAFKAKWAKRKEAKDKNTYGDVKALVKSLKLGMFAPKP